MLRAKKVSMVEDLNKTFSSTPHYVLAGFSKLTANQANDLRRKVSSAGGRALWTGSFELPALPFRAFGK